MTALHLGKNPESRIALSSLRSQLEQWNVGATWQWLPHYSIIPGGVAQIEIAI
jgi:hypothetical protein